MYVFLPSRLHQVRPSQLSSAAVVALVESKVPVVGSQPSRIGSAVGVCSAAGDAAVVLSQLYICYNNALHTTEEHPRS